MHPRLGISNDRSLATSVSPSPYSTFLHFSLKDYCITHPQSTITWVMSIYKSWSFSQELKFTFRTSQRERRIHLKLLCLSTEAARSFSFSQNRCGLKSDLSPGVSYHLNLWHCTCATALSASCHREAESRIMIKAPSRHTISGCHHVVIINAHF